MTSNVTINITIIDKSKIQLAAFTCPVNGKIKQQTIDLTPYAGQHVRVWLDADGTYSVDKNKDHFWQVAQFDVPELKYKDEDTGKRDSDNQVIMEAIGQPLDLTDVDINKWDLPQ